LNVFIGNKLGIPRLGNDRRFRAKIAGYFVLRLVNTQRRGVRRTSLMLADEVRTIPSDGIIASYFNSSNQRWMTPFGFLTPFGFSSLLPQPRNAIEPPRTPRTPRREDDGSDLGALGE
jgi:hypothetical protein